MSTGLAPSLMLYLAATDNADVERAARDSADAAQARRPRRHRAARLIAARTR